MASTDPKTATQAQWEDLVARIKEKADSNSIGNATITIQKNSAKVDDFTTNTNTDKTINITVPTSAADVSALPSSTKYGASLSLTIDNDYKAVVGPSGNPKEKGWYERTGTAPDYVYNLTNDTIIQPGKTYYTGPTWIITGQMKDQDGNNLGTAQTVDLPLESVVVDGEYDSTSEKIILTLQSGNTIDIPVGALVAGLQTELSSTNKLDADYIKDGSTNKVVTDTEKNTWNSKQNALTAGDNIAINNGVISATDTTYNDFTGASSGTGGAHGLVPAPSAGDQDKVLTGNGSWATLPTPQLVEMSYGESNAWAKFIAAYNSNCIVYCRASSNSNPATGSQTRRAFMAYVNDATTPTEVEFQYVRSVSTKTDSQQCDQVFVYKLTSASGGTWTVTTRNMASKVVAGTNMTSSYSNGTLTLNASDTTYSDFVGTDGGSAGTAGLVPAPATTDANKFLKSDGTWATAGGGSGVSITMTNTDPGEGSALAADHYIGVYDVPTGLVSIGSVVSQPNDTPYVSTANIIDGAVTQAKLNMSSFGYQPGDTVTIGQLTGTQPTDAYIANFIGGALTDGRKRIDFSILVPQSMRNITNVTLTASRLWIRHADGGYILSNQDIISAATSLDVRKVSDNLVSVAAQNSAEWTNLTNNVPLSVMGAVTLSFS